MTFLNLKKCIAKIILCLTSIASGGTLLGTQTWALDSIIEKVTPRKDIRRDKFIECPADYSIGRFYLIKCRPADQFIRLERGEQNERAQGKVHISGKGHIALVASYQLSENLAALQKFKADDIQILELSNMVFKDADLKYLAGLTKLERLDLHGTEVTDGSMPYLHKLAQLKYVSFAKTMIQGTKLGSLAPLKLLVRLELGHNNLKSGALTGLSKLQSLKILRMQNCQITDQDLVAVGAIKGLACLTLHDNSKISDAGLRHLRR